MRESFVAAGIAFFILGVLFNGAVAASTTVSREAQAVPFTALHVYYMSAIGSDSNRGTSPSSPWATPNHSGLVCGDVIIAAPGEYTAWEANGLKVTTQPFHCPSTSGGIDGTGGTYFVTVLCAGKLGSCYINGGTGQPSYTDMVQFTDVSNWAWEGWKLNAIDQGAHGMRGFEANGCATSTSHSSYIAIINDIVTHANAAFTGNDCAANHNVPGNGVDYLAVLGTIAQNSADDPVCAAAMDGVGVSNVNTDLGTHLIFDGNFAISNLNPDCVNSDGEAMMLDTWDAHGFVGTGVVENNIMYSSSWANLHIYQQAYNPSSPVFEVFNNTSYHSNQCAPWDTYANGGINIQLNGGFPWTVIIYNNIDYEDTRKAGAGSACGNSGNPGGGGGVTLALTLGGFKGPAGMKVNIGGSAYRNVFCAINGTRIGTCEPTRSAFAWNGFTIPENTYENPRFSNTSNLLADHAEAPDCLSYTNTSACMGWNYSTQTAATGSVIGDLIPTAPGMQGKGYQPPSRSCSEETYFTGSISGTTLTVSETRGLPITIGQLVMGPGVKPYTLITGGSGARWIINRAQMANSQSMAATFYPYWLKGMNYLQWRDGRLWEYKGLTNKPCGM